MPDSPPAPDAEHPLRRAFSRLRGRSWHVPAVFLLLVCIAAAVRPAFAQSDDLPLPRYASFKSNEVNLRAGAGETYPIQWVYQRTGMPVEIFDQEDNWRRIRDYQGVVGWVSVNLLTSKRTAIVIETRRTLHKTPDTTSRAVAELERGVIGELLECNGDWCRLEVKGYEGWVKRSEIWGVNPTENFKE